MDSLKILNLLLEFLQHSLGDHMKLAAKNEEKKSIAFYCDPLIACSETKGVVKIMIKNCMMRLNIDFSETDLVKDYDAVYLNSGQIINYSIFDAGSLFNPASESYVMITVIEKDNI